MPGAETAHAVRCEEELGIANGCATRDGPDGACAWPGRRKKKTLNFLLQQLISHFLSKPKPPPLLAVGAVHVWEPGLTPSYRSALGSLARRRIPSYHYYPRLWQ